MWQGRGLGRAAIGTTDDALSGQAAGLKKDFCSDMLMYFSFFGFEINQESFFWKGN